MKKVLFFALVLTIATACSQTKDSYLEGFKLFIESVQKNAQDYTKADWEKADEQFTKLKDSYNNFSKQMTSDEKGEVTTFHWSDKFQRYGQPGNLTLSKGRHEFYDYNF